MRYCIRNEESASEVAACLSDCSRERVKVFTRLLYLSDLSPDGANQSRSEFLPLVRFFFFFYDGNLL